MGGVTTLNLLRKHPDIARAAVFVDAGIMPVSDEIRPLIDQTIEAMKTPSYQAVAENVVKQFLFREESPPGLRDRVAADMATAPQRVMHTAMKSTMSEENYPAGPVPVPSLFVKAATLQATEEQIKERYPGMEVVSMDTGHFNHMEKPERVQRDPLAVPREGVREGGGHRGRHEVRKSRRSEARLPG